ncbi:MAG: hypothetical protein SFU98_04490 [Leptospiraceae bacterium]|nr:hypothetical protein [Leptospiraceae bacterium]
MKSFIILTLLIVSCSTQPNSNGDRLTNLLYLFYKTNRLILTGTAYSTGIIKNADVNITALGTDGKCGSNSFGSTTSDSNGSYSITYSKIGRPICVTVTPSTRLQTKMVDDASGTELSWTGNVSVRSVISEPTTSEASKVRTNASPFGNFAISRLLTLLQESNTVTTASELDSYVNYANKATSTSFSLSTGFSSTSKNSKDTSVSSDELNLDITVDSIKNSPDLSNSSDSQAKTWKAVLAGFSQLSNDSKDSNTVSLSDIEQTFTSFKDDFADGSFDGYNTDGTSQVIQSGSDSSASVNLGDDPLASTLSSAISGYINTKSTNAQSFSASVSDVTTLAARFQQNPRFTQGLPSSTEYSLSGTVKDLSGGSLKIASGPPRFGELLTIQSGATSFTFSKKFKAGTSYNINIVEQPPMGIVCFASNARGIIKKDITNVEIKCGPPVNFIDGNGTNGLNYNVNINANGLAPLEGGGRIFLGWSEGNRVRVKSLDPKTQSWNSIDPGSPNGINYAPQMSNQPSLINFNGRPIAIWDEVTGPVPNIRVKSFSPPTGIWSQAEGGLGINKNSLLQGKAPTVFVFNSKLYALFNETSGSQFSIRMRIFNGNYDAPVWTFADGNGTNGFSRSTQSVNNSGNARSGFAVFNGKLYVSYTEPFSGFEQVRVMVYSGIDSSPSFTYVDGNANTGLNRVSSVNGDRPVLMVANNKLYMLWMEGTPAQVQVAVYNGNDASPSWRVITGKSGSTGINKVSSANAGFGNLIFFNGKLFAAWSEGIPGHLRLAQYNGNDNNPIWQFVDGNNAYGLNKNPAQNAIDCRSIVVGNRLFLFWSESNGSFQQIRAAIFNGN